MCLCVGAFDDSSVPGVEHPDELLVWVQQNGVYAWKNESFVSCDTGTFPQNINQTSCGGNGYTYGQWYTYLHTQLTPRTHTQPHTMQKQMQCTKSESERAT